MPPERLVKASRLAPLSLLVSAPTVGTAQSFNLAAVIGAWGITDSPTGISYGGGLGLEVGPFSQVRFLIQANIWMDNAYGGSGFDPELLFGVGVDL